MIKKWTLNNQKEKSAINKNITSYLNTLNDKNMRKIVIEASKLYKKRLFDSKMILIALDIVVHYIKNVIPMVPREKEYFYLSAYFVATKHPASYPSSISRDEFAKINNFKTTTLDRFLCFFM